MWQLIRMVVGLICGFPLPVRLLIILLLPAIPGVLNPFNHVVFWLLILCPVYFTDNILNKGADGNKQFTIALRNSYFIYHALFVCLYLIAMFSVCTVSDIADSYGI